MCVARALLTALLFVACGGSEDTSALQAPAPDVVEQFDPACYNCHGNSISPAPPRGLGGVLDQSEPGVGAHRSHIGGVSSWHKPLECAACHVVPQHTDDPGHIDDGDSRAELTFSALAKTGGLEPALGEDDRCNNVYCHGATLTGGTLNTPRWTQVDGAPKECGSCHGSPPARTSSGIRGLRRLSPVDAGRNPGLPRPRPPHQRCCRSRRWKRLRLMPWVGAGIRPSRRPCQQHRSRPARGRCSPPAPGERRLAPPAHVLQLSQGSNERRVRGPYRRRQCRGSSLRCAQRVRQL